MADWTRRNELSESERPSVAVPPPATDIVPVEHVRAPATPAAGTPGAAAALSIAEAPSAEVQSRRFRTALGLSLAIGSAGVVLTLVARAITTTLAGPLPYEPPSPAYDAVVSFLATSVAVCLTTWAAPPDTSPASDAERFRRVSFAAGPIAALAIWLAFAIPVVRDESRAYDDAERDVASISVLERRAAQREAHALTQFALGAAYLRERRYLDAEAKLGYAHELDPRNVRAAELRRQAIAAMIAEAHPETEHANVGSATESDATTLKIAHYYSTLFTAGDHSGTVYEGILAGLRIEKRYDEAISLAQSYLTEHPGDPTWTARIAELRAARDRDPGAVTAPRLLTAPHQDLEMMRRIYRRRTDRGQPPDAWTEATFAFEYLKAAIEQRPFRRDSLLVAADLHARRAISLAPKSGAYRTQLGVIRFVAGDFAGADSAFAEAARLDPAGLARHPENAALGRIARAHVAHQPTHEDVRIILTPPPRP